MYFLSCGVHILCKESREFSESWWGFRPAWRPFSSTSSYGFSLGDSPARFGVFFKKRKTDRNVELKKIMWTKWKAFGKAPQLSAWLIPLAAAGSIWRRTWLWGRQVSSGFFYWLFFFFFLIKCKDFTRCASEHLQLWKIYWYIKAKAHNYFKVYQ